ncbi:hypothetical protein AB6A40_007029 [Gnathostoma spinigerum]|uniref:Uncharacterized protein n=1 Tax=Gnathostoma spinigerum TaxID=75299 RepID=A0ABD6EL95_9BILA
MPTASALSTMPTRPSSTRIRRVFPMKSSVATSVEHPECRSSLIDVRPRSNSVIKYFMVFDSSADTTLEKFIQLNFTLIGRPFLQTTMLCRSTELVFFNFCDMQKRAIKMAVKRQSYITFDRKLPERHLKIRFIVGSVT